MSANRQNKRHGTHLGGHGNTNLHSGAKHGDQETADLSDQAVMSHLLWTDHGRFWCLGFDFARQGHCTDTSFVSANISVMSKSCRNFDGLEQRTTYPIHSSTGGRLLGLIHSGDSRKCSRKSAEYRMAISGRLGLDAHPTNGHL